MWKPLAILSVVFILTQSSPNHQLIENVFDNLGNNLNYITNNYEKINVDCLYGVVLAQSYLKNAQIKCPGSYSEKIRKLEDQTEYIYEKTTTLLKNQKESTWKFAKFIIDPKLYGNLTLGFGKHQFKWLKPSKFLVHQVFNEKSYPNFKEGFSDFCLSSIINQTIDLEPKLCHLVDQCKKEFIVNLARGPGYVKTHKLLLLQLARQRNCKLPKNVLNRAIKMMCGQIYHELISIDFYSSIGVIFDLFLEQSVLCGSEGFTDFLNIRWLSMILKTQKTSGCFPARITTEKIDRFKKDINYFKDGCADHTTGLGSAILGLYVNYLLKSTYCIINIT